MSFNEIDLVIPWVNGNDSEWQKRRKLFDHNAGDNRDIRFRDWDNLQYVFRGIEKNAPWIRTIHFVTCGQIPKWMDIRHPKLHLVNHTDYIPNEYLPTFNSHTIELNMHRIEGLSEQFIYINDDAFFIDQLKPIDFFCDGKPCSQAGLGIIGGLYDPIFAGILYNDYRLLDRNFNPSKVLKDNYRIFLNFKYRMKDNLKTLMLSAWCKDFFPGFRYWHGPSAFLKSTLEEVWSQEGEYLNRVSSHKFRSIEDVNQYIFLYWQWCKGVCHPCSGDKLHTMITLNEDTQKIKKAIISRKTPVITLNDAEMPYEDFQNKTKIIRSALQEVLEEKSGFEL